MNAPCKITLVVCLLLTAACGDDDDDEEELPEVDCDAGTIPTYAEIKTTSFAKCTTCHASTLQGSTARMEAPVDVNFDTYGAAKTHAEHAAEEVNGGAMPPQGQPQPTEQEKQDLYRWALCGTPES